MSDLDVAFSRALDLGLLVDELVLDGLWHRVPVVGKKKANKSGAYCLSELPLKSGRVAIVGMLFNWVSGFDDTLTLKGVKGATREEIAEAAKLARKAAEDSRKAKAETQEEVAAKASSIWNKLPDSNVACPYLDGKQVRAWGIRFARGGAAVVPARDVSGKIWTLQFIQHDGSKRFLSGGKKGGNFHLLTDPEAKQGSPSFVGVGEGYATCASVFETSKNLPVGVAFDAGNLLAVSEALKGIYPDSHFLIFADHDRFNGYEQAFIRRSEATKAVQAVIGRLSRVRPDVVIEIVADDDGRLKDKDKSHNVGVAKAILAAAAVDGDVIIPFFEGGVAL